MFSSCPVQQTSNSQGMPSEDERAEKRQNKNGRIVTCLVKSAAMSLSLSLPSPSPLLPPSFPSFSPCLPSNSLPLSLRGDSRLMFLDVLPVPGLPPEDGQNRVFPELLTYGLYCVAYSSHRAPGPPLRKIYLQHISILFSIRKVDQTLRHEAYIMVF